jgi:hypothetical protein
LQWNEIGLPLVGEAAWSEMSSDRGGKLYFNADHEPRRHRHTPLPVTEISHTSLYCRLERNESNINSTVT